MTLDESARRLGALTWAERRLFELLGSWVVTTREAPVKLALSHASRRHGDHSLALAVLLPDTRDHDPEALVAPGPDVTAAFAAAGSAASTGARLAALDVVGPAHLRALEEFLADAAEVRDGPAIRVVELVLAEDAASFGDLAALGAH
jgi:hypothetical protein